MKKLFLFFVLTLMNTHSSSLFAGEIIEVTSGNDTFWIDCNNIQESDIIKGIAHYDWKKQKDIIRQQSANIEKRSSFKGQKKKQFSDFHKGLFGKNIDAILTKLEQYSDSIKRAVIIEDFIQPDNEYEIKKIKKDINDLSNSIKTIPKGDIFNEATWNTYITNIRTMFENIFKKNDSLIIIFINYVEELHRSVEVSIINDKKALESRIEHLKVTLLENLNSLENYISPLLKQKGKGIKEIASAFQNTVLAWKSFMTNVNQMNIEEYTVIMINNLLDTTRSHLDQETIGKQKVNLSQENKKKVTNIENTFDLIVGRTKMLDAYLRMLKEHFAKQSEHISMHQPQPIPELPIQTLQGGTPITIEPLPVTETEEIIPPIQQPEVRSLSNDNAQKKTQDVKNLFSRLYTRSGSYYHVPTIAALAIFGFFAHRFKNIPFNISPWSIMEKLYSNIPKAQ